ncbi:M6 family metalloprotease domain-containing protein [uncultured Pseudokineococcus sp.]|uniref:M6 family metalloprotease domain-containing protein n=1 Tax=uncultured Pseudokineococcus sp. TaxID=1642928 RepID=UPI00260D69D1|nr:M6 family metalloprotease domain-containing protein [uncultured Pseudokineococcus sp.]
MDGYQAVDEHRAREGSSSGFCAVAPSPDLRRRLLERADEARGADALASALAGQRRYFGLDDGVIVPPDRFPPGATAAQVRRAAAARAPLRGRVRVVVVLVEFPDRSLGRSPAEYEELFFSRGSSSTGSVNDYFTEVSGGLLDVVGEVVGPLTLPRTLEWYANGGFGIGRPSGEPRANVMADDAAAAADAEVDLTPYDNDGDGYVDAFVVVHAGRGGEETGDPGDLWSHKWVLPAERAVDGTRVYAYLTIPEDARLGVSAHELGHLLLGWPDLYDVDGTSEGVGNWCLMGGGSWNGGGDMPAHPSAWCKADQGWVAVQDVTATGDVEVVDVAASRTVHRVPVVGAAGPEHFLLENRRLRGFDRELPGDGLLVWHVDEEQPDNSDESRYLVGLLQADGSQDLERAANRGDGGDPYPGWTGNRTLDATSNPATTTHAGQDSRVAVTRVPDSSDAMRVHVDLDGGGGDGGGGDGGGGDVAARLARVEEELGRLQQVVARAAAALGGEDPSAAGGGATDGVRAWSRRPRT